MNTTRSYLVWFKRRLTAPLIVIAAVLMWLEEQLWEWSKRVTALVAALTLIRRFEAWIQQLPPYTTLLFMALPATILFPVKLLAFYWLARGEWFFSLGLIVAAKVLATAFVARWFVICRPQLMTIGWFKRLHDWLIAVRDYLYGALRELPIYRLIRATLDRLKVAARQWWASLRGRRGIGARWRAIRRWYRQKRTDTPRGPE